MEYIENIFTRMDLGQIRQFLLYGEDELGRREQPYMDRLKIGCDPIHTRLQNLYPDKSELDKAAADLSLALAAYESVYMEMGMKAGARLVYELLLAHDHPPTKKNKPNSYSQPIE